MKPKPIKPGPGQESVWEYPRPPKLEFCERHIRVVFNRMTIADTHRSYRVLETSHPPVYYIPGEDIRMEFLKPVFGGSFCEWKGRAQYYDVVVKDRTAEQAAWSYPDPPPDYEAIRDFPAFYPDRMDACYVDGERVRPQPGKFYGGWITRDVVGPFKGEPGTEGW